jgi:hypothetical protein
VSIYHRHVPCFHYLCNVFHSITSDLFNNSSSLIPHL